MRLLEPDDDIADITMFGSREDVFMSSCGAWSSDWANEHPEVQIFHKAFATRVACMNCGAPPEKSNLFCSYCASPPTYEKPNG